ncbi:MAG: ABC-type transport auxiliary lipoprotein family protein [Pseudomonadota bacterium]
MIRFLLALGLLTLGGCISLVPPAKTLPPRYTMTANDIAGPTGEPLDVTLAINDPRSEAAFNTSRIAVMTAPNEIRYLPDAEWADRGPLLISILLERSFEEHGRLLAVSDRVALPVADYVFYTDISQLHLDRSAEPHVARVSYRVRLENRRGRVMGAQRFEATEVLSSSDPRAAAHAIGKAAAETAEAASAWGMELIAAQQ